MKLWVVIFVFFLLSSVGADKGQGIARTDEGTSEKESSPEEKMAQKIRDLSRDPLLKIEELETLTKNAADELGGTGSLETEDISLSVHEFYLTEIHQSRSSSLEISDRNSKSKVDIPIGAASITDLARSAKKLTVVVAWWKDVSSFPPPKNGLLPRNSTGVTVSYYLDVGNRNWLKQSLPVDYYVDLENDFSELLSLKPRERLRGYRRACAWLDLSTSRWSEKGCVATYDERGISCACDHTTTFVTLLMLDTYTMPEDEVRIAALVFEGISIVCLAFTILFIGVARHGAGIDSTFAPQATGVNANRTNSQVSLCTSVLCMHLIIVWSDLARTNDQGCVAVAVMTHYFLLASAFWSLCEGVGIFVKVFPPLTMSVSYRTLTIAQIIAGWMTPLVITVFTAAYGIPHGTYLDEDPTHKVLENRTNALKVTALDTPRHEECWLGREHGTVWAALGPIIAIVTFNTAILCYVAQIAVKMSRTDLCRDIELSESQYGSSNSNTLRRGASPTPDELCRERISVDPASTPGSFVAAQRRRAKYIISITRSFGVLMPILAVPWMLSILSNIPEARNVFATAHVVINGLQGFQLFLLYCAVNKRDWRIVKRKWRNTEFVQLFSKHRHNRRESVAANRSREIFEPKRYPSRVDSNGNAYLHVAWKSAENVPQFDTLSSCRSSSGTINSMQSRKSLLKWWKR